MPTGTFDLKRTSKDQFMFNPKAANHQATLTSEHDIGKFAALDGTGWRTVTKARTQGHV